MLPFLLSSLPSEVDVALQRDDWPSGPVQTMGTAVNAGFIFLRGSRNARDLTQLVIDAVNRGLIECAPAPSLCDGGGGVSEEADASRMRRGCVADASRMRECLALSPPLSLLPPRADFPPDSISGGIILAISTVGRSCCRSRGCG